MKPQEEEHLIWAFHNVMQELVDSLHHVLSNPKT